MEDKNSMEYWFPKLRELDIRMPKTIMIDAEMFPDDEDGDVLIGYDKNELEKAADELGYPVFIRTDKASAKHQMDRISKIYEGIGKEELHGKVHMLADDNLSKGIGGLQFSSIAVREWLNIKHHFKAFGGNLPIGYEIRAFVRDGEIECEHFYWVKGAIEEALVKPDGWEEKWKKTKEETMENYESSDGLFARAMVERIAKKFEGWWSVDLALTEEGAWYVIDMARGEDSFHNSDCEHCPAGIKERYGE